MEAAVKFNAAILRSSKKPLEVETISFVDKLKPGQVIVKIQTTGICGSQIGEIDAVKGPDPYLPHLLGHEAVGVVIDKGDSHKALNGDQVILHWIKGSGRNAEPPRYFLGSERINAGQIATFTEYAIVSENRLTKVPNCKPSHLDAWATLGCAYLTAYGTLKRIIGRNRLTEALVLGGGGIGQATILLLSEIFASTITLIENVNARAEYCKTLGANNIHSLSERDVLINHFDSAIDTTGTPNVIEYGYNAIKDSGILALIGVTPKGETISIDPMPLHYGRELVGIYGGNAKPDEDIPELVDFFQEVIISKLLHKKFTLNSINSALSEMRSGNLIGRAILNLEN